MTIPNPKALLHRHILQALGIIALCHIVSIYIIDSPKLIYHCPLDRYGLSHLWADENCYWSTTYTEAREKFVSLGNRLKEQVLLEKTSDNQDIVLDVLDVQSLSYDIAQENYPDYIKSLKAADDFSPQALLPEKDTIDALLLTIRIPESKTNGENINIIHSSGTHGIEGYIGSAVQIRFLHELFLQNEKHLMENIHAIPSSRDRVRKVLLIHSVNPYGMRHHRRTNENNVDLNRNVLSEEMWTDIRKRDPNFVGYVDMDSTLNPFRPVDADDKLFSWVDAAKQGGFEGDVTKLHQQDQKVKTAYESKDSHQQYTSASLKEPVNTFNSWLDEKKRTLEISRKIIAALITLGYNNAKRTMVASQYHKPSGIFYGGGAHNGNTWENSIFAVQHAIHDFAGFQFSSSSSRALWIDVHTGLGRYGDYSLLVKGNKSSDSSPGSNVDSGRRRDRLGKATSPNAFAADCAQDLNIQLFDDSTTLKFKPDMQACKSGKRFVGITADNGKKHITLVPGRQKGTFTASVTDDVTGDVYSISPDANGDMMVVKRAQEDYEPELEPISPLDKAWAPKLMSVLEKSGMGYGQSSDASVSAGYDETNGFINDHILCPPPHCFSITQEFGTRPGIGVAVALILENKGYNSGERKYGHLTSWAFYPQRLSWRTKSLRGGMDMLNAVLDF